MKKRLLSLALALVMLLGLLPATAWAAEDNDIVAALTDASGTLSKEPTQGELRAPYYLTNWVSETGQASATLTFQQDAIAQLALSGLSLALTSGEGGPYTLHRDPLDKRGSVLSVESDAAATVTHLTLDGSYVTPPQSTETPRFVTVDGELTLGEGATVQNCQPQDDPSARKGGKYLPPAAVSVDGGTLTMESGSKIVNNQSQRGGVVKDYYGTVSISGDVTVKGNVAVDCSDSSFEELDTAPRTPANLVVYQTQRKAATAPIQVTDTLTGGEGSIGLTMLYTEMDPEPTTGKIVEGVDYTLTETDRAAFFSDRPGYFLELAGNTIYLEEYAIDTQPTAEVPTVVVNQTKDAAYQWYPASLATEAITDQNTTEGPYPCTYADGKWTAGADSFGDKGWFTLDLKKGDMVTVTVAEGETIPTNDSLCLYDYTSEEMDTVAYQPDKTVYTLTAPADGTYTLEPVMGIVVPVISATVTKVHLGQAVSGQDTDTLAAPAAGDYLCQVTYPDGTVLQSNLISVAAAPHKHALSVDCETTGEGLVTFDKALTVNADGVLCVDGAALTPDTYGVYTLGGGSYYLPEDITLDASIRIIDAADAPVNLCLSGHTLDLGAGRIDIDATNNNGNGVLNLCDCGAEGKVTSAYSGAYSNAATIEVGYQFSLYGGTVENTAASDTVSSNRNAVGFNGGRLNLYSGKLTSQNGNGLWVYCYYQTKSLTLSGDVAIQGGTGQAEVYFSYPSTTWEDSTHFTLAGPLTQPAAPWRVAVDYPEAEAMPLLEGWATHMADQDFTGYFQSATKGLFIGQLENKNLVLDICAITQQPSTENNYTVAANGAPASAPAYQWYPATVTTADITTANAAVYGEVDRGGCYQSSAFEGGKWTASEGYDVHHPGYFTLALQRGDKVTVTLATADKPSDGQLGLVRDFDEPGEYVQVWYPFDGDPEGYSYVGTAVTDGDNTVITYPIPADGSYDLRIDGLYGSDQTAPVISATLTRAVPGAALTGQTAAKLNTTGLAGGTYLCRVTWPDGTATNSDVVTYTPPHVHNWASAWSKDTTYHWHECTADGCTVTANADKNGYDTHSATGDWQKDETNHWKLCVCGQELSKTEHVYDDDADATCNTCGYTRTVTPPTPPDQGDVTGEVEVKPGTPAVDVDEEALKDLAGEVQDGDTVTVKLTVEKQGAPADKADIEAVVTGDKANVLYLDLSLVKRVNDNAPTPITDTGDKVLEIAVPYDFTGKKDVTVYRKHGDNDAEKLTALAARPTENYADGSFFADSANGVVYIYASKFSTYAIGYTAVENLVSTQAPALYLGSTTPIPCDGSTVSLSGGGTALFQELSETPNGGKVYGLTLENANITDVVRIQLGREGNELVYGAGVLFLADGKDTLVVTLKGENTVAVTGTDIDDRIAALAAPSGPVMLTGDGSLAVTATAVQGKEGYGVSGRDLYIYAPLTTEGSTNAVFLSGSASMANTLTVEPAGARPVTQTLGEGEITRTSTILELDGQSVTRAVFAKRETPLAPLYLDGTAIEADGQSVNVGGGAATLTQEGTDYVLTLSGVNVTKTVKMNGSYAGLLFLGDTTQGLFPTATLTIRLLDDAVIRVSDDETEMGLDLGGFPMSGFDPVCTGVVSAAGQLGVIIEGPGSLSIKAVAGEGFQACGMNVTDLTLKTAADITAPDGAVYVAGDLTLGDGYAVTQPQRYTLSPSGGYGKALMDGDAPAGRVTVEKKTTPTPGYRPGRPVSSKPVSTWPFTDVKTSDASYEAVKYVYEKGWMLGTSDTTFSPEGQLTRAMLATVLYRAAGSPTVAGAPEFEDTNAEQWYSNAIAWASQTQVLRGYGNGKFGPEDPVSQEMLHMVMGRLKGEDPAWTGDPALALPATRAQIAQALMEQDKK